MDSLKTILLEKQVVLCNFHYRLDIKEITKTLKILQPQSQLKTTWLTFAKHHPYQTATAVRYLKETAPLLVETLCLEVDPYHKFLLQQAYWEQIGHIKSKQHYQKCAAQLTKILIMMRHYPTNNPEQVVTKLIKEKQEPTCF